MPEACRCCALESHNRRGISKVMRRGQILPQQILRYLDGIDNYAIGTHRENARRTLIFLFVNILVVDTLDFNIYAVGRLRGRRGWMNKQKAPESVRTSGRYGPRRARGERAVDHGDVR